MRRGVVALFPLIMLSTTAFAGDCGLLASAHLGATAPLAALVAKAKQAHTVKSEFETTEVYQARSAKAAELFGSGPIITSWPLMDADLHYNADAGRMTVGSTALSASCGMLTFGLSGSDEAVSYGTGGKATLCLETAAPRGNSAKSAVMQNAHGTKVKGSILNLKSIGIYLGNGSAQEYPWADGSYEFIARKPSFDFPIELEAALVLKENASAVIVVRPKRPFFAQATSAGSSATIISPIEINESADMLVADVICIAIADRKSGRLYGISPVGP